MSDGVGRLRHLGEQDQELVAAVAAHRVRFAHRRREAMRRQLEHLVADRVAERVVDLLEVVEVQEQQRQARAAAPCTGDGVREPVEQQHAIGQLRSAHRARLIATLRSALARRSRRRSGRAAPTSTSCSLASQELRRLAAAEQALCASTTSRCNRASAARACSACCVQLRRARVRPSPRRCRSRQALRSRRPTQPSSAPVARGGTSPARFRVGLPPSRPS